MRLVDEGYITLTYNDPIPEAGFLIFMRSVFEDCSDVGDKFMLNTTLCWRRRMFATNRNLCPEVKSSRSYFSPICCR